MKRAAVAVLSALFAFAGMVGAAPANAASPYGDVTVTISDITVVGGTTIVINADTNPAVNCNWTVTFKGESSKFVNGPNPDHGTGSSFHRTYSTNPVSHTVTGTATATCTYDDTTVPSALGGIGRFSAALAAATQTASATGTVTLLPKNGNGDDGDGHHKHHKHKKHHKKHHNGHLPNTGGERLAWLLIGLALVAGGTTVVVSSRKRDSVA